MSTYSWKITRDFLADDSAASIIGPRNSTFDWDANPDAGEEFRMYDDDGELYYQGRITGQFEGFEPLDDFGTPHAVCTRIDYKSPSGEWVAL